MELQGGCSGRKSVTFESDTHIAKATYNNGEINVDKYKKENIVVNTSDFISRIPFIRAYWISGKILIRGFNKITLLLIVLLNVMINYFGSKLHINSSSLPIYYYSSIVVIFLLFLKLSPVNKFHGAEHKVANCFWDTNGLDNNDIKNSSRISDNCGSNLLVIYICVLSILSIFLNIGYAFLLGWSIAYELFYNDDLELVKYIIKPFYLVGKLFQKYIATSEPTQREIDVAVASLKSLLEEGDSESVAT